MMPQHDEYTNYQQNPYQQTREYAEEHIQPRFKNLYMLNDENRPSHNDPYEQVNLSGKPMTEDQLKSLKMQKDNEGYYSSIDHKKAG